MLKCAFLIVTCCLPLLVCGQKELVVTPSKFNLGLNLVPLYGGTPELQVDYYFNRYIGVVASGGYTFHPARGGISIGDNAKLSSLHGSYGKIGLKGRMVFNKKVAPVVWGQVMYVISQYDEHGSKRNEAGELEQKHNSGIVNGAAIAGGVDIRLFGQLDIKLGMQLGTYKRDNHLGSDLLTYQPGFGSKYFFCPVQGIVGITYRIGSVNK